MNGKKSTFAVRLICIILAALMVLGGLTYLIFYLLNI